MCVDENKVAATEPADRWSDGMALATAARTRMDTRREVDMSILFR